MSNFKLQELAPYLPYKVNVSDGRSPFELTEHNFTNVYRYITKIYLRPLTEIDSYFRKLWDEKDEEVREYMDSDFLERFNNLIIDDIPVTSQYYFPVGLYNLLLKHHFDIFDLFEKGLAENLSNVRIVKSI